MAQRPLSYLQAPCRSFSPFHPPPKLLRALSTSSAYHQEHQSTSSSPSSSTSRNSESSRSWKVQYENRSDQRSRSRNGRPFGLGDSSSRNPSSPNDGSNQRGTVRRSLADEKLSKGLKKWGLDGRTGAREEREDRGDRVGQRDRFTRPQRSGFGVKGYSNPYRQDPDRGQVYKPPGFGVTDRSKRYDEGSELRSGQAVRVLPTVVIEEDPSVETDEAVDEPEVLGTELEEVQVVKDKWRGKRGGDRESRSVLAMLDQGDVTFSRNERARPEKGKKSKLRDEHITRTSDREKRIKSGRTQTKKERDVYIPSTVTVARLADIFGVKLFQLRRRMLGIGINEDQTRATWIMSAEEACNVALEFGMNPIVDDEKSFDLYPEPETESGQLQPLRPPVVTIMGHVDHGKTTLLDALRHTAVAAGEAGGITQHIGAFSVPLSSLSPSASPNSTITFLDTPGHAAFTAMRARGASVTDIVVLVVAADDGVMPQTKEVINLVKNSDVGLVVAINKCDKPGVDIARVKRDLGAEGLLLEEDGGDVQSVRVSGLTKLGLDELVETISTLAELRDLRARQDGKAEGYVLESRVDKGRGNIATVLVTRGTLKVGASIVSGITWCRVRQMLDSRGQETHSVLPGTPIAVTGWKELPVAGDEMLEAPNGEDEAKRVVENRERDIEMKKLMTDLETLNIKRREDRETLLAEREEKQAAHKEKRAVRHVNVGHEEEDDRRELRLVIKADVSGTVEAVVGSLEAIGNKEAGVKVVHTGVGDITESDIDFASASDATIIGFSVEASRSIQNLAKQSSVTIHVDQVIYRLIDLVRSRVSSLLPPKIEKRVLGEASVLQLFPITIKRKTSMVAGCRVNNGILKKSDKVRVLRGTERKEVFEGSIHSLKHLKKDVEEVHKGMEFGIQMEGWNEVKEGDEVVTFNTIEIPREI